MGHPVRLTYKPDNTVIPDLNIDRRVERLIVVDLLSLSARGRDKEWPLQTLHFLGVELPVLVDFRAMLIVMDILWQWLTNLTMTTFIVAL